MNIPINFSGHHVDVSPALKEYATEKLARLEKRGDHITHINVTLAVEKLNQIAKATLHVKGAEIHASHESGDMYASIDGLVDKLNRQITKHRDSATDHH
jgi:putative sigma-54 modulation protein